MASGDFYGALSGIPIDYLVATPLLAAARANTALAENMQEFIFRLAYEGGAPGGDTITLDFVLERPFTGPDGLPNTQTINGFGAFKASGSVTTDVSRTRSSNQSATYTFNVQATQQPATEGMSRLLDVFASTIEPLPSGNQGGN